MQQENKVSQPRKANKFKEDRTFYDRLYDRLYTVVERYALIGNDAAEFTIFLTAIPRYEEKRIADPSNPPLGYQGLNMQKGLLDQMMGRRRIAGQDVPFRQDRVIALEQAWAGLEKSEMYLSEMYVSGKLFHEMETGSKLEDLVQQGTLKDYFEKVAESGKDYYKYEHTILESYGFDLSKDRYLSVPLFQFGERDGVVHIIYQDKGFKGFNHSSKEGTDVDDNIKDLIVGFSIEYEGVVLAWHLSYDEPEYDHDLRMAIDEVMKDEFWKKKPAFFDDILAYPKYYRNHKDYFHSRFRQHDNIRKELYLHVLNQAVITVLLDSYAHNVGAHSLTSLTGIFSERASLRTKLWQYGKQKEANYEQSIEPSPYRGDYAKIINTIYPKTLALEIAAFFRFLQEKSGFWSGLTRDLNPGGLVSDLYEALMQDFVSNALYLGTVAESEGIFKVNLNVSFLEDEITSGEAFGETNYKTELEGCLAYVDVSDRTAQHQWDSEEEKFYLEHPESKEPLWYMDHPELEELSRFVCPGNKFAALKKRLKEVVVFWPGSSVGKHAFFNIVENELRNIKHATEDALKKAKEHGLDLHISIQKSNAGGHELFRVGVWLGIEADLGGYASEVKPLIMRRFDTLWEDIIDTERNPKLSGNTQDKVCAAMLFNNSFSSVQNVTWILSNMRFLSEETRKRDIQFYPWITPAVSLASGGGEFQMRPPGSEENLLQEQSYFEEQKDALDRVFQERYNKFAERGNKGFLKKYFYLWEGQNVRMAGRSGFEMENIGRFKVVLVDAGGFTKARRAGVIRVLQIQQLANMLPTNLNEKTSLISHYEAWLRTWIGEEQMAYYWADDYGNDYGVMLFDKSKHNLTAFYSNARISEHLDKESIASQWVDENGLRALKDKLTTRINIQFAHSDDKADDNALRYRKHGVMNRYFFPQGSSKRLRLADLPKLLFPEFLEMMATRICVVDTRVQHRMHLSDRHQAFYSEKLNLLFCAERASDVDKNNINNWPFLWGLGGDAEADKFVKDCHFLVLHLSFIERLLQEKYLGKIRGDDIDAFIKYELLSLVGDGKKLRQNFLLVVTSGRGRSDWWKNLEKLKSEFASQVIFRPIEAILAAIEGHSTQKDDFELKYRLTKVLFGS